MRRSWASCSLAGALLLVACGSKSGTGGTGGGGAGATGGSGTAGAGAAGNGGSGGTAGAAAGSGGADGLGASGGGGATGGTGTGGGGASGTGGSLTGGAGGTGGAGRGGTGGSGGGAGTGGSSTTCLPHDIDIPATLLRGKITVQGIGDSTGTGTLDLKTPAGDNVLLGWTPGASGSGEYYQVALPGIYDIVYRLDAAGPGLPANKAGKVRSGIVLSANMETTLDVQIAATAVSGTFTMNGKAPMFAADSFRLRNASGDDAVMGTSAMTGTFATIVIPGTYDLYYIGATSTMAPRNISAKLQSGIVVGASPATVNVDVPATTVSGSFTVNGSTTAPGSYPPVLMLQSVAGDTVPIATKLGAYTAVMVPGTYDVIHRVYSGETGTFLYQPTKVMSGVVLGTSPVTLNVDVPATTLSGTVTVNGAPVDSTGGNGRLTLRNDGATRPFATTAAGTYSTPVIAGTYDLYYTAVTVGTGVPSNKSVKLRSGIVIGGSAQTLNIDIPATTVTGTIRVNGAQVDSTMGSGELRLRNAAGDDALLGTTATVGAYSRLVVAGTYDLYYGTVGGGPPLPVNLSARIRTGIVVGSTPLALDIDVAAPMVSGTISPNGALSTGSAVLNLQTADGDKGRIASTRSNSYSARVIPGTYELIYSISEKSYGLPFNTLGRLGCYTVP